MWPMALASSFFSIFLGQRVDVQAVHHAAHLGLDPAVAVLRKVDATGNERLVIHPRDGGLQLALAFPGGLGGGGVVQVVVGWCLRVFHGSHDPVATGNVHFAVQHDAGAGASFHIAGFAHGIEHPGRWWRSGCLAAA